MPIFQVPKKMPNTLLLCFGELFEYDFANLLVPIFVIEGFDILLTGIERHRLPPLMHGDIHYLKKVSCHPRVVMGFGLVNGSVFGISS